MLGHYNRLLNALVFEYDCLFIAYVILCLMLLACVYQTIKNSISKWILNRKLLFLLFQMATAIFESGKSETKTKRLQDTQFQYLKIQFRECNDPKTVESQWLHTYITDVCVLAGCVRMNEWIQLFTENSLMIYALPYIRTATRSKCHTNIENRNEDNSNWINGNWQLDTVQI